MRFIVDECCPRSLIAALADAGHDASYVRDVLGGASDADIAAAASKQGRIIVTQDHDFGDLAVRSIATPTGVILIQAADLLPVDQPAAVVDLVENLGEELVGRLVILGGSKRRVRKL